ncbi:MAG: hypothetical protein NZ561_01055 [Phycisphaerae bacterium]|nr:hypothetical protein [Phycisphaerae bacterium]MDW8262978.1 hypothetical protein [Phycisphaerales bacterium]
MPDEPEIAVVVTTIGKGEFLDDYFAAAQREDVLHHVTFFVIADRKSPPQLFARCMHLASRGMRVVCPTLEAQESFAARVGFDGLVPFDSDNRRNLGYLMALASDAQVIISIDDDNFPRADAWYFREHSVVARPTVTLPAVKTTSGWYNLCSMLECKPATVYPRGFPYQQRHRHDEIAFVEATGRVTINAGLWLSEPDLDGMTWLVAPARATALKADPMLLGRHTWSPINTQNTAVHRDAIASYYFARMNYPLAGMMSIDRYGDILSGYFAQACAKALGHYIRVGTPLVDHRRNAHNYLKDATCEMGCIWLIEDLAPWLVEQRIEGSSYSQAYRSLSALLDDAAEKFRGIIWNDATRGYLHQLAYCMRRWTEACTRAQELRVAAPVAA